MKNKKLILILSVVLIVVIVCVVVACVVISKNSDEDSSSESKSTSESKKADDDDDEDSELDMARETYEEARNTVNSAGKELSEQEAQLFNAAFEIYEGDSISGGDIGMLIRQVISSNASNDDYPIEVEYEGTTYASDSELNSLRTSIRASQRYSVSFEYSGERISKIIIE